MPEYIRYQILSPFIESAIGCWPAVLSPDATLAISSAQIYIGIDVEASAGIPSKSRERLHLVMLLGVGHKVDIQIAYIFDKLAHNLARSSLTTNLQPRT